LAQNPVRAMRKGRGEKGGGNLFFELWGGEGGNNPLYHPPRIKRERKGRGKKKEKVVGRHFPFRRGGEGKGGKKRRTMQHIRRGRGEKGKREKKILKRLEKGGGGRGGKKVHN